ADAVTKLACRRCERISIEIGRFEYTYTMIDETNSPTAVMNASRLPAIAPGNTNGKTTRRIEYAGVAPRLIAASSILGSTCCRLASIGRTTIGMLRTK